ncbi:LysE family translocator [Metabacillus indicus]|uniref:Lysine transporter LysE n=1 Tax=Metabacillus indicus TaxID=246786 RepID=A0A084GW77_METID|nr:LysE family translocator [Metabacillus indicus]KEZ51589.1 lysine transporter LysE [Metabacillus indicus]
MNDFFTFIVLSLFVVMSPGIDTALITNRTISGGKRDGFKMALGITAGALVHTFAAAFGLSAVLMQSAAAFEIVKYIGAAYLIYLGVTSFISKGKNKEQSVENPKAIHAKGSAFKQGFFSNVLNPKVAIFFLTFLPQFVNTQSHAAKQLILMGIIYTLMCIVWFIVFVIFINYLRKWLMTPRVQSMMDKATGIVLIAFGLKLALERQH